MRKTCVECGKKRTLPKKFYVLRTHYEADPYCSRKCCETAHGVVHLKGSTSVYYKDGEHDG